MPTYAIVLNNTVTGLRELPDGHPIKYIDGLPVCRPFVEKTPTAGQKKEGFVIFDDRVERGIVDKTADDLAADALAEASDLERQTVKLFFKLCKALIAANVLSINDPNLAEIKTAYLRWKNLTGN